MNEQALLVYSFQFKSSMSVGKLLSLQRTKSLFQKVVQPISHIAGAGQLQVVDVRREHQDELPAAVDPPEPKLEIVVEDAFHCACLHEQIAQ